MELHQVHAFIAVAQHGQLLRAGEHLHLSPSAVSKQIKGLEAELNVLLFDRAPAGMVLTNAGRRLLPIAMRMAEAGQQMSALAASLPGNVSGPLRLGTIIDPESIRLGKLLAELLQYHPMLEVSLVHGVSAAMLQQLRDGKVDATFYLGWPVRDSLLCARELITEHYVVVGPAAWRDRLQGATWEDVASMPWLSKPPGSPQNKLIAQMFAERGLAHTTVVEADQEQSVVDLVQSGVALGLMRERAAAPLIASDKVVIWDGARLPCPLSLLYRRASEDTLVIQALLSTLSMVWQLAT